MFLSILFLWILHALIDEVGKNRYAENDGSIANDVAIVRDGADERVFIHLCVAHITYYHKNDIPNGCTQCGEDGKSANVHLSQTSRNGNELSDSWNHTSDEG